MTENQKNGNSYVSASLTAESHNGPMFTIDEHGVDVLLENEFFPARDLPKVFEQKLAVTPSHAEQYYAFCQQTLMQLKAIFDRPASDEHDIERETMKLYNRRLFNGEGMFIDDLVGLTRARSVLEDWFSGRTYARSLFTDFVPRQTPLHIVGAERPHDDHSLQKISVLTTVPGKRSMPLREAYTGTLGKIVRQTPSPAAYVIEGTPACAFSDEALLMRILSRHYSEIKRQVIIGKLPSYPVILASKQLN